MARREVPVFEKRQLEIADRRPLDPQVGVAPRQGSCDRFRVLVANVDPAGEAHAAVADDDLAVGAEVHQIGPEAGQGDGIEAGELHTRFPQRTAEPPAEPSRANRVDQ